jgi:CHASE2 domain-containing sensor protein
MSSQLVAAAMNERALIWWWPVWAETLWLGCWAGIGGLVLRQLIHPRVVVLAVIMAAVALGALCYGALVLTGLWLPIVPALLAGGGTAGLVAYFNHRVRNP